MHVALTPIFLEGGSGGDTFRKTCRICFLIDKFDRAYDYEQNLSLFFFLSQILSELITFQIDLLLVLNSEDETFTVLYYSTLMKYITNL